VSAQVWPLPTAIAVISGMTGDGVEGGPVTRGAGVGRGVATAGEVVLGVGVAEGDGRGVGDGANDWGTMTLADALD
jgi:hypothetical protein